MGKYCIFNKQDMKEVIALAIEQEKWEAAHAMLDLVRQMEKECRTSVLIPVAGLIE